MRHFQAAMIVPIFLFASLRPTEMNGASAKPRAIEVLSDPYGVGNPTHYTVIRGTTKVTFSHAMGGQFSRAEVTTREKSGDRLTRFLLSNDNKTYRPTLRLDSKFEKFNATVAPICNTNKEPSALQTMDAMNTPIRHGELIAKTREELERVKFFDPGCTRDSFEKSHYDAVANAAADVITLSTQSTSPKPKFLKCLADFGFAEEAGEVSGWIKQTLVDPTVKPGIKIACSADPKMKMAAHYSKELRTITLKKSPKANRADYSDLIFHEFLHLVEIRDETPIYLMEECCSHGDQCELLKKYGQQRHVGEKRTALAEAISPAAVAATGLITALAGVKAAPESIQADNSVLTPLAELSMSSPKKTEACLDSGPEVCRANLDEGKSFIKNVFEASCKIKTPPTYSYLQNLIAESACADDCTGPRGTAGTDSLRAEAAIRGLQRSSLTEQAESYSEQSPLTWETKSEKSANVQLNLASSATPETRPSEYVPEPSAKRLARTIASISPLPESQPRMKLGQSANRRDVDSGRATALVDTLEKAARVVTQTLTPEKIDLLKVDYNAILAKNAKPISSTTQFIVAAIGSDPIKVASIASLKDLGFENPFLKNQYQVNRDTGAMTLKDATAVATEKLTQSKKGLRPIAYSAAQADEKPSGASNSATASNVSGLANAFSAAPSANRAPSAKAKRNFKIMTKKQITDFVTSSYRDVADALENDDFGKALAEKNIRIVDHEGRKIGAQKPKEVFVYRQDISRLVLISVARDKK